jgi:L-asparaginase
MQQPNVLVIYTGGTIGMVNDPITGSLTAFDFGDVYKHIPELGRLNVKLTTKAFEHCGVKLRNWSTINTMRLTVL